MADVINQTQDTGTGKSELWITIKDASDLLGISERHTWRILLQNAWKTQKLLNKDRKKTYILRSDLEKYYHAEQERQKLEQLTPSPSSDTPDTSAKPDKISLLDKPDNTNKLMSDNKNSLILMSDYRNMLVGLQKKQEQLVAKAVFWKTSAIWFTVLAVFISGFMGFFLYDTKKVLSDNKQEMSGRINDLSDRILEAQRELLNAKEALFQKEIMISKLEQSILAEKLEQLTVETEPFKMEERKEE